MLANDLCSHCKKAEKICICDKIEKLSSKIDVVILQHPQEQDFILGSASLVHCSLPNSSMIAVGLSWPSLKHILEIDKNTQALKNFDYAHWIVLFPLGQKDTLKLNDTSKTQSLQKSKTILLNKKLQPLSKKEISNIQGVIVLDGTWSQAKTLWWRNPWLLKCQRMVVYSSTPSMYGRLRKEPQKNYLSTLEVVAEALLELGEPIDVAQQLRKVFRTLLQRIRD